VPVLQVVSSLHVQSDRWLFAVCKADQLPAESGAAILSAGKVLDDRSVRPSPVRGDPCTPLTRRIGGSLRRLPAFRPLDGGPARRPFP